MLVIRSALLSLALTSAAMAAQLDAVTLHAYHITPGPLGATLSSFAVDAGIALSFLPALTEGLTSPGLSGSYSTEEAVTRLLAGSGLEMVLREDGSYTLVQRRVTLSQTTVSATEQRADSLPPAYSGGQVAVGGRLGMLGNSDVMDAPFSVSTYTAALIKDQQATTVGDLLERDSSVRSTGQTGGIVDSFFIRGFPVGEGNLGELAFDIKGRTGLVLQDNEFDEWQRLFLFSRADTIYGGSNEIQRNVIAERVLGLPREARG